MNKTDTLGVCIRNMDIAIFKDRVAAPFKPAAPVPIFSTAAGVVAAIKSSLFEQMGKQTDSVKAVESGVVEEHAVVGIEGNHQTLLVRIWPVFYAHPKRVDYRLFTREREAVEIIQRYLRAFAEINHAELTVKD
ncbi:MAG: hypothetical protein K9K82_09465 [Desulfobacteraceae bacterium]|nr:hypothetical protein [Desulfobacteraceae bacterium]